MTSFELEQLYYLRKSVKRIKDKIIEYTMKAESGTSQMTDMPHGSGVFEKVGEYAGKIVDLRKQKAAEEAEIKRLETFLENISDTQTRLIIQMRYDYEDKQPQWKDIAAFVGGGNTEENVRQICCRYFEKENENDGEVQEKTGSN